LCSTGLIFSALTPEDRVKYFHLNKPERKCENCFRNTLVSGVRDAHIIHHVENWNACHDWSKKNFDRFSTT